MLAQCNENRQIPVLSTQSCVFGVWLGGGEVMQALAMVSMATSLTPEAVRLQGGGCRWEVVSLALTGRMDERRGRMKGESVVDLLSRPIHSLVSLMEPLGSMPG